MKLILLVFTLLIASSCTNKSVTLEDLKSGNANIYRGGMVNQTITSDSNNISIRNIWKLEDGLRFAEEHCQNHGKTVVSKKKDGITGYYVCGKK